MNTFKILARSVLGIVVAVLLTVGFAGGATAEPAPAPAPVAAAPTEVSPEVLELIAACMPPGDSLELRTGLGLVVGTTLGFIAGLPVFIFGSIPGAMIGAVIGAMAGSTSYALEAGAAPQHC
ncbi:hypothetical protein ACFVMC_24670 [Nocardia sp. NPDC127579]|uniref:hypothetical protein n=1 Tax=Nocardia sp. NPDC127579 TaxID=3345402 RepID=UPI00362E2D63